MVYQLKLKHEYFDWMCELIDTGNNGSYNKLLRQLDDVEFIFTIDLDDNRLSDGIHLRYRFGYEFGYPDDVIETLLDVTPCSVLEMMVALSFKCEEDITGDPEEGDRTGLWFWNMIDNLGLSEMTDSYFDADYVNLVISRFLNREYSPNGKNGLFTVKNPKYDMREVEIWYQMMWYLDEYLKLK